MPVVLHRYLCQMRTEFWIKMHKLKQTKAVCSTHSHTQTTVMYVYTNTRVQVKYDLWFMLHFMHYDELEASASIFFTIRFGWRSCNMLTASMGIHFVVMQAWAFGAVRFTGRQIYFQWLFGIWEHRPSMPDLMAERVVDAMKMHKSRRTYTIWYFSSLSVNSLIVVGFAKGLL